MFVGVLEGVEDGEADGFTVATVLGTIVGELTGEGVVTITGVPTKPTAVVGTDTVVPVGLRVGKSRMRVDVDNGRGVSIGLTVTVIEGTGATGMATQLTISSLKTDMLPARESKTTPTPSNCQPRLNFF